MIQETLAQLLNESASTLGIDESFYVVKSNRAELCDYQCDNCFKLAKKYDKKPIELASMLVANLKENKYLKKIEAVQPGFINMSLSDEFINSNVINMNSDDLGFIKDTKEELFIIDFGGANIAKPLHVGHMRTTIVGESLRRIITFVGHKTISDVHLGDYGLQIGQVIYGILEDNKQLEDIDIAYLEAIYPKMSALCKTDEVVKQKCSDITKALQDGHPLYQSYFKKIKEVSVNDVKRLYDYLSAHFDLWLGESDAYQDIPTLKKLLEEKKLLTLSDNAYIINVSKETDSKELPPLIFEKSNGAYLYSTTDLATIYSRIRDYQPAYILYVVDNRQELHFEQVFRVCELSGLTPNTKLEFLGYGTVNGTDGKPFKTRSGNTPKLDDLFKEVNDIFISKKEENKYMSTDSQAIVVNAILKFADLQNSRDKDYIFDIQKFTNVIGKTGPYILYTYARINKILKDSEIATLSNNIYNEFDRKLRLKLIQFAPAIRQAFANRMPNYIAEYLYELCVIVNAFYENNHINNLDDIIKKQDWLYILNISCKAIKKLCYLLGIDVLKVM